MALFDPPGLAAGPVHPAVQALLSNLLKGQAPQAQPVQGQTPAFAAGDPGYQAALAAQLQGNSQSDSALKAAREQLLIQFGDPNMAAQFQNLDPAIKALIQANSASGNSVLSRLQHTQQLNQATALHNLAARGLLKSGALGGDQSRIAQDYGHGVYDAQQNVLGQLNGALQTYLQQKQGTQATADQALQSAYQNYISTPALYTGAGGPQQTAVPGAQAMTPHPPAPRIAPAPVPRPGGVSSAPGRGVYAVN